MLKLCAGLIRRAARIKRGHGRRPRDEFRLPLTGLQRADDVGEDVADSRAKQSQDDDHDDRDQHYVPPQTASPSSCLARRVALLASGL